jgi:fructosamine-3-kinase
LSLLLPDALFRQIEQALRSIGEEPAIQSVQNVPGGCINHASCLTTKKGTKYFLKWNSNPQPGMFSAEAHGLNLIASTHTIRVPSVFYIHEFEENSLQVDCPSFVLLEWIQPPLSSRMGNPAVLGEQLAALHHFSAQAFGLEQANYLGSTRQINTWFTNWKDFFGENRLRFQYDLADQNGLLPSPRRQRMERLMGNLERWLGSGSELSSLLHGDLWAGNCIATSRNAPVLIDPAVYYGNREAEIAYTELFGGFDSLFYSAYQSAWPLDSDYNTRRDLYNLYHLLNHLNIFGEAYSYQVDAVLQYYVG